MKCNAAETQTSITLMEYGGAASVDEDIACLRGDRIHALQAPGFMRAADILLC